MTSNDSRESRAADAERRRQLEGNTRFADLGEPIQRLLLRLPREVSDSDIQLFRRVTVRQLAKVFDMLAQEEDPDAILRWLQREIAKSLPPVFPIRDTNPREELPAEKETEILNADTEVMDCCVGDSEEEHLLAEAEALAAMEAELATMDGMDQQWVCGCGGAANSEVVDPNPLLEAINEDDQPYSAEDEAEWQSFLESQAENNAALTPEQSAEFQLQEEERLAAEANREAADADTWDTLDVMGVVEDPDSDEFPASTEEDRISLAGHEEDPGRLGGCEEGEDCNTTDWAGSDEQCLEESRSQPHQWKLPLRQVTNPQSLKSYFTVIKYTPSHSLLGGRMKRIWVVDHFTRCFYNLDCDGKIKKEHPASALLQLEKSILDSSRLRLTFAGASHSYELQFQSAEERERFYETASAIRSAVRVYAPDLTHPDPAVETSITTVDGIGPEAVSVTCKGVDGKPTVRELCGECKINASKLLTEPLSIWTGTFNLSGRAPPRSMVELEAWMPRDKYDIYAIAVQEASYRQVESEWFDFVKAYLGSDYLPLADVSVWDTLLIVLCRKKHLLKITNIEGSTKATVHKSVCGAKGGVGISFRYLETSICFVNVHLAARLERSLMRNTNLEEIIEGIQLGVRETDFCNQFQHVFLLGDLNYRVELDMPAAEKLIEERNFSELLDYDQLTVQRRDHGICFGFEEPPITFAPTYRLQLGTEFYHAENGNAPSYCDRILTRSTGSGQAKCTSYKSHPEVKASEHVPVSATFILRCIRPVMSCFAAQQSPTPMFVFHQVRVLESTGPVLKRPALLVHLPFSKIQKRVLAKTHQTSTPQWGWAELPKLCAVTQVQEFLETGHILFVLQEAAEKCEERMHRGTAVLTLAGRIVGLEGIEQDFEADICFQGKSTGTLKGTFHWEPVPIGGSSS